MGVPAGAVALVAWPAREMGRADCEDSSKLETDDGPIISGHIRMAWLLLLDELELPHGKSAIRSIAGSVYLRG